MIELATIALSLIVALPHAEAGEDVQISSPREDDVYLAGEDISISAEIDGDLVAAGESIRIRAPVLADAAVAADNIELGASIGGDARLAGREVTVGGSVGEHLIAAGQSLRIDATIGHGVWAAGETVHLAGSVSGDVELAGRKVTVDGVIDGNASLVGENVSIGPNAKITGEAIFRSDNDPDVSPRAQLLGGQKRERLPVDDQDDWAWVGAGFSMLFAVAWLLGLAVFAWMFRSVVAAVAQDVRKRVPLAAGVGLGLAAGLPVLCLLLGITVVGLALAGVAALSTALIYLVSPWVGTTLVGHWLSERFKIEGRGAWLGMVALAGVALQIVGLIPLIGFLFWVCLACLGMGGLAIHLYTRPSTALLMNR